ncbi:unnamed protein product, partial [Rotaria sp. Silwood1]
MNMNFTWSTTQKGEKAIRYNDYLYRLKRENQNGSAVYTCVTDEDKNFLPSGISTRTKKKIGVVLSPDNDMTPSPTDSLTNENRYPSTAG